jgi:NADPH-dependent glutamate synthase beta subunit-like oxidoreductase/CO/xanthine dehydrogenase FAD-binding subunit
MKPFESVSAESLEAAGMVLAERGAAARPMAGGTDLLGTVKDDIHARYPELLVNLKTVPGLEYIREDSDGLVIGALTRLHDLETDPIVQDRYPLLAQAAHAVASPQVRNMGTVAGNICQEPRCWYYRAPDNYFDCTRKGGRYCNALVGENRFHSVFGSSCVDVRPCTGGCPGSVGIPEYLAQLRAGDVLAAARTLLAQNPLPAVTGRVCPHPCEQECNRGLYDEPVSVRGIERHLGDYILEHTQELLPEPEIETGKRVAVVGSGPSGLSAAYYLRAAGHTVTVFEKLAEPGGMLRYAIPSYRLPLDVVERAVDSLKNMGVIFVCGAEVGKDVTLEKLRAAHDAVFLACGAWGRPGLGLENEERLDSGLGFLTAVKEGLRQNPGERVVVIGGGNVAVDVALAAKRLGSPDVTMVCLECEEEMPALPWELALAQEEGVKVHPSWGPARILVEDGHIAGLELVRCTCVFDEARNFNPQFDQNQRKTIPADRVFLAIGQKTELASLDADGSLRAGGRWLVAEAETQATSLPGVFAGGDVVSGPATVIAALAAGRRAAAALDISLHREGADGGSAAAAAVTAAPAGAVPGDRQGAGRLQQFNAAFLAPTPRVSMPELPVAARGIEAEDALGLPWPDVETEANRCFNCGCVAVIPSDLAPALVALEATVTTTMRTLPAGRFFSSPANGSTVLMPGELVKEIRVPSPAPGTVQSFQKFRIRKSIDFPIVSVAAVLQLEEGSITEARLVLGALAPVPIRAHEAEVFLKGKRLGPEVVDTAAVLALRGANPLARNAYKVQVARALARRALEEAG